MRKDNRKRQKKSSPAGCLFWVAVILLFIIIFFLNQKNIEEVISSTGFFELFNKNTAEKPVEVERITPEKKKPQEKTTEIVIKTEKKPKKEEKKAVEPEEKIVKPKIKKPDYNFRDTKLYFVSVDSEGGNISMISINRRIKYTDSPLTATLEALLAGLTTSELNSGYISLIPDNTQISGIRISDGTAYISFNENFLFNSFGREGYIGQLKQVVYTATEYSTVKRVQFLIEGKKQKYLGSEGIFIGNPLSRNSFKK